MIRDSANTQQEPYLTQCPIRYGKKLFFVDFALMILAHIFAIDVHALGYRERRTEV